MRCGPGREANVPGLVPIVTYKMKIGLTPEWLKQETADL